MKSNVKFDAFKNYFLIFFGSNHSNNKHHLLDSKPLINSATTSFELKSSPSLFCTFCPYESWPDPLLHSNRQIGHHQFYIKPCILYTPRNTDHTKLRNIAFSAHIMCWEQHLSENLYTEKINFLKFVTWQEFAKSLQQRPHQLRRVKQFPFLS